MSGNTITVFGGTGAQGGGVIKSLLADSNFSVRVFTRDSNSDKAKKLSDQGCQIFAGDLNELNTVESNKG